MDARRDAETQLAQGRRLAAVRRLLADGSAAARARLSDLSPDGPGGTVLAERLRFGPPETWMAWRRDWGRVTLKLASPGAAAEARAAFRHPGVAPLLGWGAGWTAHAWIDGMTLAAALRLGPAPPETLAAIAVAVAALHAAGLAHGDLTPSNIVQSAAGPVLIDWGEDTAGTPGWRPDGSGTSPAERDLFALDRLRERLAASHRR